MPSAALVTIVLEAEIYGDFPAELNLVWRLRAGILKHASRKNAHNEIAVMLLCDSSDERLV